MKTDFQQLLLGESPDENEARFMIAMEHARILVVEDERLVAADLAERVRKLGYDVSAVADSTGEAITKAAELKPDLVLMDIQLLGGGDGVQAVDFIRRNLQTPVLFVSTPADGAASPRTPAPEPFGCVVTPFQECDLRTAVQTALSRANTEAKLRKLECWLSATLKSIGDAVIATDLLGRVRYLNPVAEGLTGWTTREALGRDLMEIFRAKDATGEFIANPALAATRSGMIVNLGPVIRLHARDDREFPIDVVISSIRDDEEQIIGAVLAFRDSSERERAESEMRRLSEQLEQRVRERTAALAAVSHDLESFSYSVSHDLHAPLRAISGFARILAEQCESKLDADSKRLLNFIRDEGARAGQMVDNFLELAHLDRRTLHFVHADMNELAQSALEGLHLESRQPAPEIVFHPLPPAWGDTGLLRQVWVNLLSNAIKFSSRRDRPHIEIGGHEEEDGCVYFVRDNGVGFDMKYANKLFATFQRLHSTREFDGIGVGLAIVQRILHRHEGRVWAEATRGQGATFYFTLPTGPGELS
jgi:two-component system, cell cycle sensor histidine kinase and response regulator CckA